MAILTYPARFRHDQRINVRGEAIRLLGVIGELATPIDMLVQFADPFSPHVKYLV
jgi:hypothetical protein